VDEQHRVELDLIPWETRSVDDLNAFAAGPARFEMWMRTPAVDGDLAPALTAYATDLTLIGTALRPLEGFNHRGNGTAFTSAVTSHTIWFHRPFRTDRWLLLRQHSPVLAHGRCFGRGDVLSEDGSLVASYAQEALLRFREAGAQVEA
jgi:acyl-CoA thioesterase II